MKGRLSFVVCTFLGCSIPQQGEEAIVSLDRGVYEASIEAILQVRCANPSCHGRVDRPFSMYTPGRFREQAERVFLDEPLSEAEKDHNFWTANTFANLGPEPAAQRVLVQKPLGTALHHEGGAVFSSEKEGDARRLITWIEAGDSAEQGQDL